MYKSEAFSKVAEIEKRTFEEFCQESNSISLLNGLSGVPFFYWNLYNINKDDSLLDKMSFVIDKVLTQVNESKVLNYCDGIAGVGYMLNYFIEQEILDEDIEGYLHDLDQLLLPVAEELINTGNTDFLHGGIGISYYLLQRSLKDASLRKAVAPLCNDLLVTMKREANMDTNTQASLYDGVKVKHLNLGMAHGLISNLFLLSKFYDLFPDKKQLLDVVNSVLTVLDQYAANEGDDTPLSVYPSIVNESGNGRYDVPLGWCYGDSITALGIHSMARKTDNAAVLQKSNAIALRTLSRNSPETAFTNDACVCHGAASNAMIYLKWYKQSEQPQYLQGYQNWIGHTLKAGHHTDGIAGYKRYYGDSERPVFGMLDGVLGIGLVLMDYLSDGHNPNWSSMLLID